MSVYEMQELTIRGPWKPAPRILCPLVRRFGKRVSMSNKFRFGGGEWMGHELKMLVWWKWSLGASERGGER